MKIVAEVVMAMNERVAVRAKGQRVATVLTVIGEAAASPVSQMTSVAAAVTGVATMTPAATVAAMTAAAMTAAAAISENRCTAEKKHCGQDEHSAEYPASGTTCVRQHRD